MLSAESLFFRLRKSNFPVFSKFIEFFDFHCTNLCLVEIPLWDPPSPRTRTESERSTFPQVLIAKRRPRASNISSGSRPPFSLPLSFKYNNIYITKSFRLRQGDARRQPRLRQGPSFETRTWRSRVSEGSSTAAHSQQGNPGHNTRARLDFESFSVPPHSSPARVLGRHLRGQGLRWRGPEPRLRHVF